MAAAKDIFISYRRETGAELAEIIKKDLSGRGYSVFKDTHDLKAGHWQDDLGNQINGCKDFILVVTPGTLDRCKSDPDDVVLFEIRLALAQKKNFILVVKRAKGQSPDGYFKDLPSAIADLPKHNWIEYTNEDADAKLKKIRSFLDSSPSLWELASNRHGKKLLAGIIGAGLVLCGLLGWGIFGKTGRIEKKVEVIADDTKANLAIAGKIQDQNRKISEDTGAIRKDNSVLLENTKEIKQGINNLGKLKGLVASPQTPADFYHNANVHRNDGNFSLAEEALLEYFKRKTDDFYDPYKLYTTLLEGRNFSQTKVEERVDNIIKSNPSDKGARLLRLELDSLGGTTDKLREMISKNPDYLPAYLVLIEKLPIGLLMDDVALYEVVAQFKKNGDLEKMKEFILDATNKPGRELLEIATKISGLPKMDPMKRLLVNVVVDQDITLLWTGVSDNKPGQKIIFTLPDSELVFPLNSPDNPAVNPGSRMVPKGLGNGSFVAIEISRDGEKNGKPRYVPREGNDIRIFPHSGSLEGVKLTEEITAKVSYVDTQGRKYTFPDQVRLFGTKGGGDGGSSLFGLKIERNTSPVMGDFSARLVITPSQPMEIIRASGRKEGPFRRILPHMAVPTMNEAKCEDIPYLEANNGIARIWIRATTESGKAVETDAISVRIPAGIRWKTHLPVKTQEVARELKFTAPPKIKVSAYHLDTMAFSPDGKLLAAQYEGAGIVTWNTLTGEQTSFFAAEKNYGLFFNGKGTAVTNGLLVLDIPDFKKENKMAKNSDVFGMTISSDFSKLVTTERLNRLVIYDFRTLKPLQKIDIPSDRGVYRALAISPNGNYVATAGQGIENVLIIEMGSGKTFKTFKDLDGSPTLLAFSPDGRFLLGGGQQSKSWLWNLETEKDEAAKIQLANRFPDIAWAGDLPVVIDRGSQSITIYNARTGARINDFPSSSKFAASPSGNFFAVADYTGIKLFDLKLDRENQ